MLSWMDLHTCLMAPLITLALLWALAMALLAVAGLGLALSVLADWIGWPVTAALLRRLGVWPGLGLLILLGWTGGRAGLLFALALRVMLREDGRPEWQRSVTWRLTQNQFIGWDQQANVAEGGDPDETLSSKSGRIQRDGIDCAFCTWWIAWRCRVFGLFDKRHCPRYASPKGTYRNGIRSWIAWRREMRAKAARGEIAAR